MIQPSDIEVTKEDDPVSKLTRITCKLRLTTQAMIDRRRDEHGLEAMQESRCKREIWRELYGDLEQQIFELRRKVLPNMILGAFQPADEAFGELLKMVRDPFTE